MSSHFITVCLDCGAQSPFLPGHRLARNVAVCGVKQSMITRILPSHCQSFYPGVPSISGGTANCCPSVTPTRIILSEKAARRWSTPRTWGWCWGCTIFTSKMNGRDRPHRLKTGRQRWWWPRSKKPGSTKWYALPPATSPSLIRPTLPAPVSNYGPFWPHSYRLLKCAKSRSMALR